MIAAIYARKSTDQSDVSDAEKSVTRQIERARELAGKKGWQVIEEYVDDGISGRESAKLTNRARMLADATAGKFSVVVVRDYDRLSRDDREGPAFVYMLQDAGAQVWEYATGGAIDTSTALKRTMLNMKAGFSAHEAEAASDRTREQKRARASRGEIADGRVLGYRTDGDTKVRRREVDPKQAEIVVRIFEMAADGKGLLKIAKTLNAEEVPNPTGQSRKGSEKSARLWSSTGIREILRRDLYRGIVVYGRTRNLRKGGKRIKVAGDAPLTVERPELRIVSDELWAAAHKRMAATRAAYLRRNNGQLGGKPESGLESRYLLSGFLRCGVCQGPMMINKRTSKRGRPQIVYVCTTHRTRGDVACPVKEALPVTDIDAAVVRSLREILTAERLEAVIERYVTEFGARQSKAEGQRAALVADLARIEGELTKLADAVAGGAAVETLLAAIKAREAERRDLRAKLEHLDGLTKASQAFDRDAFAKGLRAILKDWNTLMAACPADGRRVLRDLHVGPILVARTGGGWCYKIAGDLNRIVTGLFETVRVPADEWWMLDAEPDTAGVGQPIESSEDSEVHYRWCPRGDSNTRHAV